MANQTTLPRPNPVARAVMMSYTGFLAESLAANDPRHAELGEIDRAAARGSALTRQLLAFSRQQPIAPQLVRVQWQCKQLCDVLRRDGQTLIIGLQNVAALVARYF